mmetsp:Transcript_65766/g.180350  ORF Transcript_65766/g.180350 Transcript_65766/m.180350 type:complete len:202 (-) Transcript_65766:50-655(-)
MNPRKACRPLLPQQQMQPLRHGHARRTQAQRRSLCPCCSGLVWRRWWRRWRSPSCAVVQPEASPCIGHTRPSQARGGAAEEGLGVRANDSACSGFDRSSAQLERAPARQCYRATVGSRDAGGGAHTPCRRIPYTANGERRGVHRCSAARAVPASEQSPDNHQTARVPGSRYVVSAVARYEINVDGLGCLNVCVKSDLRCSA